MKALRTAFVLLVLATAVSATWAQGVQTGILRGTIVDAQGLAVPGATVTVTSPALQGPRSTVSGADGTYAIRLLPAGTYQVKVELSGFNTETASVAVPLGGTAEQDVAIKLETTKISVTVSAVPPPLATPTVGANLRQEEIEALATSRTLQGIATLSPAVNENTPNTGQLSINGAFGYDNLFMLNGVDVNDNLFGTPQNLFIEDAIEETQVLTSGISAEYGRFSGGVVNAVTKSGGNVFSGSFRVNLTNPAWVAETPFEVDNGIEREGTLNQSYEGTFGGPIVRDRIWFFGAGRSADLTNSNTFPQTGAPYSESDDNWRLEGKVTATVAPGQTVQGGFVNNSRTISNTPSFDFSIEPATLTTQKLPNWYAFGNYRGTLSNNLIAEGQYSERRYTFEGVGGTSTAIIDSPFITLTQELGHYNAPYFDATDPEERNNRQLTGSVTYVKSGKGTHELKGGYEYYRSQNTGGNSQSATSYVFDADYLTDVEGSPVLDSAGRLIPVFVPADPNDEDVAATLLENWIAFRGATLNVDNHALYAQDHWSINQNFSADLGFRYERVRSEATGNIVGVDTDTWVPRLALSYDVKGDGRYVFHTTYGHYAGRYNESQIGVNSNVGNPDETIAVYHGPAGTGRNFGPGLNPANYEIVSGDFPTINTFFEKNLSSPVTKEFTASGGVSAGTKIYGEATYVWRNTTDLIEDFIELDAGATDVVRDGIDYGSFSNREFRNSDIPERHYQALVFQGRYRLLDHLSLYGAWTIQLQNEGNFEGENANQPGAPSVIGDYPEAFNAARHYPMGRLQNFQRHRARVWGIYDADLKKYGTMSVSGLWRFESGLAYSLVATGQRLTSVQRSLLADYVDEPQSQDVYFGERGSETFPSYGLFDVSLNYGVPVFKSLRPWVKFDVFNLFNNDKLIAFDTTVLPDPNSPVDALGLRTGYIESPTFGEALSSNDFPKSLGTAGGRTFRMAFGFRF